MTIPQRNRLAGILIIGAFLMLLIFGFGQVSAAPGLARPAAGKLTPSPTFDPVLYQVDSTPITIAATLLVGIVFFALLFVIFRQKDD